MDWSGKEAGERMLETKIFLKIKKSLRLYGPLWRYRHAEVIKVSGRGGVENGFIWGGSRAGREGENVRVRQR